MAKEKSPSEQIKKIKKDTKVKEYTLVYDSFGEGLEPAYYWVLDFLREDLDYEVEKIYDQFAAAEASGYYGELGIRRTALEKRAMEIMQTLGVIVKSILQLLWDLKEFELRLDHYKKLKSKNKEEAEAADNALKAIWLTEVDIKKGRGSINVLTQDLNFVTLRDAFMVAKSVEDVAKMDLNERVKRILKYKIKEYLDWRKRSEAELKKRYQVEKAWLKSQVNAMKLYTRWARPYLIATQKLMPLEPEKIAGAEELVTAFDVMRIDLVIFGKKAQSTIPLKGGRPPIEVKIPREEDKVYRCIEVEFRFRSTPAGEPVKGHFTHRGKVEMFFRAYVMTGEQIKKIKELEEDEVLQFLEGMTTESLHAMRDDLARYVEEIDIEKIKEDLKKLKTKEEKKEYLEELGKKLDEIQDEDVKKELEKLIKKYKVEVPFIKEIQEALEPIKKAAEKFKKFKPGEVSKRRLPWYIKQLKELAKKGASDDCWTLYDTYKNAHKMIRW